MIGLENTDIFLNDDGQPVPTGINEILIVSDVDCFIQDIKNEAVSQEGELFYDTDWGWSMLDFSQMEYDELVEIEIQQRVREKLSKREVIDERTIETTVNYDNKKYDIHISFKFYDSDTEYNLDLNIDGVEVTMSD